MKELVNMCGAYALDVRAYGFGVSVVSLAAAGVSSVWQEAKKSKNLKIIYFGNQILSPTSP